MKLSNLYAAPGLIVYRVILLAFIIFCYYKSISFGIFMFLHLANHHQKILEIIIDNQIK